MHSILSVYTNSGVKAREFIFTVEAWRLFCNESRNKTLKIIATHSSVVTSYFSTMYKRDDIVRRVHDFENLITAQHIFVLICNVVLVFFNT